MSRATIGRYGLLAASAATAILLASTARADTIRIRTSDLDLASAAGQAELDARIDRAVRNACRIERSGTRLVEFDEACRARATTSAREALAARGVITKFGG